MNPFVQTHCKKLWDESSKNIDSRHGDSDTLFPQNEYSQKYTNTTFIPLTYKCQCKELCDCGVQYQIIETIVTREKKHLPSLDTSQTFANQNNNKEINDKACPNISWSFDSNSPPKKKK
eukprot:274878_1